MYTQFAGKTVETLSLWAETNQHPEGDRRLHGRNGQGGRAPLRRDAAECGQALSEAPTSLPWQPATWQESYQKAFRLFEGNIQAVSRSAERVQSSAEQAGKGIQEAFSGIAEKLKGFSTTPN